MIEIGRAFVEIVGLGLFPNGYVYDVDAEGEDRVYGDVLDDLPVKRGDTDSLSPEVQTLMELTHEQLDQLADESNKVTFGSGMKKIDKAKALAEAGVENETEEDN